MKTLRFLSALLLATSLCAGQQISSADYASLHAKVNNAGRWGQQDTMGTLNHIGASQRRAGLREARDGVSVSLARTIESGPIPGALEPAQLEPFDLKDDPIHWQAERLRLIFHGYAFSHMDALSHAAYSGKVYNGASEPQRDLAALSVTNARHGIITRGVLVDLTWLKGVDFLEIGTAYTPADMEAWEKKTGIKIHRGDVVLVRTGKWTRQKKLGPVEAGKVQVGPHPAMAAWLHQREVAMIGDDWANDFAPTVVPGVSHPFHMLALVSMGMQLLDNLDLDEVAREAAARKRWTFLFVAAPLPLKNTTGSPLNPLAVF